MKPSRSRVSMPSWHHGERLATTTGDGRSLQPAIGAVATVAIRPMVHRART